MKAILLALCAGMVIQSTEPALIALPAAAETAQAGPEISAPSALLMEASTGQVIYEKNADES